MAKSFQRNFKPAIRHEKANLSSTPGRGTGGQRLAGVRGGRDMGPPRQESTCYCWLCWNEMEMFGLDRKPQVLLSK